MFGKLAKILSRNDGGRIGETKCRKINGALKWPKLVEYDKTASGATQKGETIKPTAPRIDAASEKGNTRKR